MSDINDWPEPGDFELENGCGVAGIDGIDWDSLIPAVYEAGTGRAVWLDVADLDYSGADDHEYPDFDTVTYTASDNDVAHCARCDSTIEVSPLTGLCWSCEQALREDEDGEGAEPDFPPETNDVTSQYIDGTLQITLSRDLDKRQVRAFCYGATQRRGVKGCELDGAAGYERGYTPFTCTFNPKYARLLEDVRADLAAYARDFLAGLVATPMQASLFEAVPTQGSMF